MEVIAVLICGRFFYYVAKDARISNTPPNSELEDRVSLLWTWFGFLAAYVCQLLGAIGLIIGTRKGLMGFTTPPDRDMENIERETVLGNCQLWIQGAHILHLYTFIESLIVLYYLISVKSWQGSRGILIAVLAIIKISFRVAAFIIVKLFMADLSRPSCSCHVPSPQQQSQENLQQPPQAQPTHHPQQPQMMVPPPQQNSQYQPATYHPT